MDSAEPDFNDVDRHCCSLFPEVLQQFSEGELRSASAIGSYIFHEDYFVPFVVHHIGNEQILRRVAAYVEHLASQQDSYRVDLAEVGILESFISRELTAIAPHLGPRSKELVEKLLTRFDVDPDPWVRC